MRCKSVLPVLVVVSVVILAVAALSNIGRAQNGRAGDEKGSTKLGQQAWEEWPHLSPETMQRVSIDLNRMSRGVRLVRKGDTAADKGDWESAKIDFQQAQELFPSYSGVLYGLGRCADTDGDKLTAVRYYRMAIYSHDPHRYGTAPGDGYQTNDVGRMMEYVLLFSQTGNSKEALSVYRRAARLLNYEDGRQNLDVLLPDFSPSGWAYTPKRLQAMAHIAIAHGKENFDDALALSHLQQAVALAPDSPLPYFYRAHYWSLRRENYKNAKADYAKAAELGDAQVSMATKKATAMLR